MPRSVVADHLRTRTAGTRSLILEYFCDFAMSKQQTEVSILRSLLTQVMSVADADTTALISLEIKEPNKATAISSLCEAFLRSAPAPGV